MRRVTYGNLQSELARIAGASGMNVSDPRVMSYANLATEELVAEWDWPQLCVWMKFKTTSNHINVPSEFDRILSIMVNGVPMPLQSPYFEFVGYGPQWPTVLGSPTNYLDAGLLERLEGVLDREQVATFQDIPSDGSAYLPTVYASVNEMVNGVRPLMVLQGYDQNGQWIRSQNSAGVWIDGIELAINGDTAPYAVSSSQPFSVVTAVQKPITNGYLSLYVSGTQPNYFLGTYAPYDQNPFYRRYDIPNLTNGQSYNVVCRLRKRFAPIQSIYVFLLIPNLPALSSMVQAVYYREAGNPTQYATYKAIAVDILKKEMTAYIGKQRQKPLVTMNEGAGVRRGGLQIL